MAMVLALQPIVTCAETLRATATAASHYLSDAIECPALASAPVFSELLAWGYFNPFGPTTCSLFLVDVPTADEQIIFFRWLNPFATGATAYGLVPNTVAGNPQQLASVLERLFAGGAQERSTSPRKFPSHVRLIPGSSLDASKAKDLILLAAASAETGDLGITLQRLREYKGHPWRRTAVERDEAFAHTRMGAASVPEASPPPPNRAQLEEWWRLVTDPEHGNPSLWSFLAPGTARSSFRIRSTDSLQTAQQTEQCDLSHCCRHSRHPRGSLSMAGAGRG